MRYAFLFLLSFLGGVVACTTPPGARVGASPAYGSPIGPTGGALTGTYPTVGLFGTSAVGTSGLAFGYVSGSSGWQTAIQKLNIVGANVATKESTASTTFTDLTTPGPAVTLTTGTTATVWLSADVQLTTAQTGHTARMAYAVSGSSSKAPDTNYSALAANQVAAQPFPLAGVFQVTGLTPGSNTFTAKYEVDGYTFYFWNRTITVVTP